MDYRLENVEALWPRIDKAYATKRRVINTPATESAHTKCSDYA